MTMVRTRQQRDLEIAVRHIREVQTSPMTQTERDRYGGLCHTFPILVLTNGLCQAVAFLADKGANKPEGAHRTLLGHVAELLEIDRSNLLSAIQNAAVLDYIRYSERIIEAWVFYKRFAVSMLDVDAGTRVDADGGA
ncbi:MAG: type III-B CRISPR module-associated protein Cmr5 [Vicinamibacterales bacterium]